LKVFNNTALARPWRDEGQAPAEDLLYSQREDYPQGDNAVIPKRGLFLVAGVDVQPDRLEVEVVAFGRNNESWSIAYEVIRAFAADGITPLPVNSPEVWIELEKKILNRQWKHELGGTLQIWLMAIDTGDKPKPVYDFTLRHPQPSFSIAGNMNVSSMRCVVAIKGTADDLKVIASVSAEDVARRRGGIKIVGIGTNFVKTHLFDSLRFVKPDAKEAVPNAAHFPKYSLDYFKGLCSEERTVTDAGKVHFAKKGSQRNEPLDCRVYAIAAAVMCGVDRFQEQHWRHLESLVGQVSPVLPQQGNYQPQQRPQRRVVGRF
jgi:phage terminase large subunit GpA-like protein